jgi:hypothetical protein
VETSWKEIAARVVAAVREHPDMAVMAKKSDFELREWCQGILEHLSHYLTVSNQEEASRRFRMSGRVRFEENMPLHEAVLRFQILHEKILVYVHEQAYPSTAVQLFSEEELEQRMRRFFNMAVYYVVRGYEDQLRRAFPRAS